MLNSLSLVNSINNQNRYGFSRVSNVSRTVQSMPIHISSSNYKSNLGVDVFSAVSFKALPIRTSLIGKDEHDKYNEVSALLDKKTRKDLQELLKIGKLLDKSANDNSTTLDNLYKIATQPRVDGLDKEKILRDVISTIKYPFNITQKFGDIPNSLQDEVLSQVSKQGKNISADDLDVKSSTCPAASIEFDLAHRMPAEFARMAAGLTSQDVCIEKTINVKDLSQGLTDTIWMLNEFGTEHKLEDWNTLKVVLRPDSNAIIRARIQNSYQDSDERSPIDVLMQSTFMNIGAQNTYDSIVDRRIPKYNEDDSGLIDIEKNFAEELATGKGKVCVTYQKIDDNGRLVGYECEQHETLAHIQNTLNTGNNVIIGYTYCDEDKNVIGGHEITIIGIETDRKGNKFFVCNDTDDGISSSIKYPVQELLPRIHHAGIPKAVLVDNVEFVEGWRELMDVYKVTKAQQELQRVTNSSTLSVLNQAV